MDSSAVKPSGKWAIGSTWRQPAALVTVAALACVLAEPAAGKRGASSDLFGAGPPKLRGTLHAARVPLPKPRPADAPAQLENPATTKEAPAAEVPAQPSACRKALTEDIAIAPSIPDIHGPGGCGGSDLVRLEAIVLADKHRVAVSPPATLRCPMALEVADWVRTDIGELAAGLGSEPGVLDNFDSFECRGMNRVAGAPLSQHGLANALDVRAIKLADGKQIALTDRNVPRDVRERVLRSACTRFTTVLGPGSDGYHEDHIHLDRAERHNNYRICQWNVWDPLPQVAPLLPAERPQDAPPRELATDDATGSAKPHAHTR
jgi:hypothetical protein